MPKDTIKLSNLCQMIRDIPTIFDTVEIRISLLNNHRFIKSHNPEIIRKHLI